MIRGEERELVTALEQARTDGTVLLLSMIVSSSYRLLAALLATKKYPRYHGTYRV